MRRNAQDKAHRPKAAGVSKKNENQHVETRETKLTPEGDWDNEKE